LTPEGLQPEIWEFEIELEPLAEPTILDLLLEPLADVGVEGEMGCAELEAFDGVDLAEDGWTVLEFEIGLEPLAESTVFDLFDPLAELEGPVDEMMGFADLEAFDDAD